MKCQEVQLWLEDKQSRNYGAVKEHTAVYYALFTRQISPIEAATQLNDQVSASKHKDAGWRFRQVLLAAISELPEYHEMLLKFTQTVLDVPLTALSSTFGWDWDDQQRYLSTRKEYRPQPGQDMSASIDVSEVDRNVNFVAFSARLARASNGAHFVLATAFFDLRDALEWSTSSRRTYNTHFSEQELKWIDVEVAAQWIIHGKETVLRLKNEDLGEGWERGLAAETDLWKDASGLSVKRWMLWRNELVKVAQTEGAEVPVSTKAAAAEAAHMISAITES